MAAGRASEMLNTYKETKLNNDSFNAFSVEIIGTWSTEALSLANKIGSMLIKKTGDRRAKDYFFRKNFLGDPRANAACKIGTQSQLNSMKLVICIYFGYAFNYSMPTEK